MAQPKELLVETAAQPDWIAIAHLNVWAYREFSGDLGTEAWPEMVRKLTSVGPAAETATFFVVRNDENLLGSVAYRPPGSSLSPVPPAWASIDLLAVSPAARGEGVGEALVIACIGRAGADGAPTIGASVNGLMTAAQGLFSGLGFHREQGLAKRGVQPYWLHRKDLRTEAG
ncbi:MAG TPA: GNAT family N-acetyltransferase [Actinomycetota bacterium]|nr:GNAT family N-acetyltransferase [Actinomycetota bacterium]